MKFQYQIILFLLFLSGSISAQSSNQYMLSPISFIHDGNSSINLVSSELLNTTNYSTGPLITQGFYQPENFILLSVEVQEVDFFIFYPNPISEGVFIEFKKDCGKKVICSFFNFIGQEVKIMELNIEYQSRVYINLSELKNGAYLMKLYDVEKEISSVAKLIKR